MKLSIITINLNNVSGLHKTIESVVNQTCSDFEYIIIDGGSTDGSVEVIKEFQEKITYWVSEPDKGIYNAMNKGILKAKGEYCLFLNSGDWLADDKVVSDFCATNFKEDVISGSMMLWENGKTMLREVIKKDDLGFEHFYDNRIPHPASFIKKKLFSQHGLYNEEMKIVADWEFFLKCLVVNNCQYNHFQRLISYFDLSGLSSQQDFKDLHEKEVEIVIQKYLPLVFKSYKKIKRETLILYSHENAYREYMNLKNGKSGFLIQLILFLKRKKKQYT